MKDKKPSGLSTRAWLATKFFRWFARVSAFFKVVNVTVVDREMVPKYGAVIVASNHISMSDPVFLWGALRRRAVMLAMAELWNSPFTKWLMKLLGHIPVFRGDSESGKEALRIAESVLRHGGLITIYPSGKCIRRDNDVGDFKPGVALLAMKTGAPIVPVGIVGSNNLMPLRPDRKEYGLKRINPRAKVRLQFGPPINPSEYTNADDLLSRLQHDIRVLSRPV